MPRQPALYDEDDFDDYDDDYDYDDEYYGDDYDAAPTPSRPPKAVRRHPLRDPLAESHEQSIRQNVCVQVPQKTAKQEKKVTAAKGTEPGSGKPPRSSVAGSTAPAASTRTTRQTQPEVNIGSRRTSRATRDGDIPSARPSRAGGIHIPPYRDPSLYEQHAQLRAAIECADAKRALHVVVLGHVDAGKSTLMGRLLHDLGYLDDRAVRKNQQAAQAAGKASFGWAWAMDERDDERERGLTVDVSMRRIQTDRYAVTLLDAPGHQDFVPNLVPGAAQADAALLVVDGAPGGFEAGFGSKKGSLGGGGVQAPRGSNSGGVGQTKEHVHVARSAGIKQLAVVVTKLDTCDYSQERFQEIQEALGPFLKSCGFSQPQWLPVSAPEGENVSSAPTDKRLAEWWPTGCTLVDAIDKFEAASQELELPFRMLSTDVAKQQALSGKLGVCGKVETGAVAVGSQVLVLPAGIAAVVKELQVLGQSRPVALAGESVDVGLAGVEDTDLEPGSVLCHPEYPVHVATRCQARVLVVNCVRPIIAGQVMVIHMHSSSSPCRISKLVSLLDPKTGQVKKSHPAVRVLLQDQAADVELELEQPVCMEVLPCSTSLGRFLLRMNGRMTALGSIRGIPEGDQEQ